MPAVTWWTHREIVDGDPDGDRSTGAAGAAVPIESYHTTLPWSSRASSPVTRALLAVVELNRPTVKTAVSVCLLLLLLSPFCSCVAFFALSLFCCTLGCTYYQLCIQLKCTYGLLLLLYLWAPTRAAAAVPMTCSIVLLGCCCCCYSSIN